jgi:hypothetical protein
MLRLTRAAAVRNGESNSVASHAKGGDVLAQTWSGSFHLRERCECLLEIALPMSGSRSKTGAYSLELENPDNLLPHWGAGEHFKSRTDKSHSGVVSLIQQQATTV